MKQERALLAAAESVLVIGGGLVGVEITGSVRALVIPHVFHSPVAPRRLWNVFLRRLNEWTDCAQQRGSRIDSHFAHMAEHVWCGVGGYDGWT
jgi:hypothetical protein